MDGAGTLGSEGEQAALDRIIPRLPPAWNATVGPGDDAAVMLAPDGRFVVTTDTMVNGPDFRLAWSSFYDLGWKALVTNLSDVAAMGADPTGLAIAIAAPATTPVHQLESFADGVREACEHHAPGCALVGGDLAVSDTLTIAVTAFGDLDGRAPVLRSGARDGDVVAVAGSLGFAGAGIALLYAEATEPSDGVRVPSHRRAAALWEGHRAILQAQLRPESPLGAGVDAAKAGATAMIDVSDGLLLDASRVGRASAKLLDLSGTALDAEAMALVRADPSVGSRALDLVLTGGEDHALLATFPRDAVLPSPWRVVGSVHDQAGPGSECVTIDGAPVAPTAGGWDPYRGWDGITG